MKTFLRTLSTLCLALSLSTAFSQCPAGYNQAILNWDYLDFFTYTGNYTSANGYLSSNALSQTQNFAFGTQRVTITHNFPDANSLGENGTHTGETGSYGTGDDINFNSNGTITFTFENEVQNLKFSIYDLDNSQSVTITGVNAASVSKNITITKATGSSALVLTGSGTATAVATSLAVGSVAVTSNTATLNVDVAGPVKKVTLVFGGTAGDFWISDLTACSVGSFPTSYYNVSKPFTGQPGYVLHSFDSAVYAANPANGVTKLLFIDTANMGSSTYINSMGYDPYNRILYYVYSLTASPATNKILKKYDFNTGTISTVLADITTIGIPVSNYSGVESGAAAFYNGALFLGVETPNASRNSGRESVVWRIDFTGTTPYRASQVFALPADNGSGTLLHDWSDFAINNGVLYDFDGAGTTTQTDIYQYNMLTGATVNYNKPAGYTPGQPAVDWQGNIYQLHAINPGTSPYIALYNSGAGTIGTRFTLTSTPAYIPAIPSLGDAAEAFRPLVDYGDAPASYDPVTGDPAVHELDSNLRLGVKEDKEWLTRGQTTPALSDNFDDGLPYVSTFNALSAVYLIRVSVYNHTGAAATMCGWLDYNGNGKFDAAEGVTVSVPNSASQQLIYLYWPSITSSLSNGTYTYLRIRLTSTTNGMTTSNPTGYFNNGEVEDYRVPVNTYALASQLLTFDAQKTGDKKVNLQWQATNEDAGTVYTLERSADAQHWIALFDVPATGNGGTMNYTRLDAQPLKGNSYYRLKIGTPNGNVSYTQTKKVNFENKFSVQLTPNPASEQVKLLVTSDRQGPGLVRVLDMSGRLVLQQTVKIEPGENSLPLAFLQHTPDGVYTVQLQFEQTIYHEKLIMKKQ
jgi:hypothetical protein